MTVPRKIFSTILFFSCFSRRKEGRKEGRRRKVLCVASSRGDDFGIELHAGEGNNRILDRSVDNKNSETRAEEGGGGGGGGGGGSSNPAWTLRRN